MTEAYTFLDDFCDETTDKDLSELLKEMNPFVFVDRTPADRATWQEWN